MDDITRLPSMSERVSGCPSLPLSSPRAATVSDFLCFPPTAQTLQLCSVELTDISRRPTCSAFERHHLLPCSKTPVLRLRLLLPRSPLGGPSLLHGSHPHLPAPQVPCLHLISACQPSTASQPPPPALFSTGSSLLCSRCHHRGTPRPAPVTSYKC